jgi:hypothetical protein
MTIANNDDSKISKKTKAGVFIIESLDFEDEQGTKEGEILYSILQMSGILLSISMSVPMTSSHIF